MRNNNEKSPLAKTPAFRRSFILLVLGIPMMYVASLSGENIACAIAAVIYVILLLVNGITCIPIVKDLIKGIRKDSDKSSE